LCGSKIEQPILADEEDGWKKTPTVLFHLADVSVTIMQRGEEEAMRRMLLLAFLTVIFGCEAQDAPPEPKSAKASMVEQSYDSNNVLRDYEAILAARQQPETPPTPPPKPKETLKSLTDKLKRIVLEHPDKIRRHWEKTSGLGSAPPKPPQGLQKDDWVKWYKETKKWAKANKEAFKKWLKGLVAETSQIEKPPKPGRAPMSMFLDEAANVMRSARSVAVFNEVLKKYQRQIEAAYKDDVKRFPELEQVARPWMNAFERFKRAIEAGNLQAAKSAVTDMMLSWRNWNLRRRQLRGE